MNTQQADDPYKEQNEAYEAGLAAFRAGKPIGDGPSSFYWREGWSRGSEIARAAMPVAPVQSFTEEEFDALVMAVVGLSDKHGNLQKKYPAEFQWARDRGRKLIEATVERIRVRLARG